MNAGILNFCAVGMKLSVTVIYQKRIRAEQFKAPHADDGGFVVPIPVIAREHESTLIAPQVIDGRLQRGGLRHKAPGIGFERGHQYHPDGKNFDDWRAIQGGFRTDWTKNTRDTFTVQGDVYSEGYGEGVTATYYTPPYQKVLYGTAPLSGGNVLGRWRIDGMAFPGVTPTSDGNVYAAKLDPKTQKDIVVRLDRATSTWQPVATGAKGELYGAEGDQLIFGSWPKGVMLLDWFKQP